MCFICGFPALTHEDLIAKGLLLLGSSGSLLTLERWLGRAGGSGRGRPEEPAAVATEADGEPPPAPNSHPAS